MVGEQGHGHEDVRDHVPDEEGAVRHDLPSTATADRVRNQFYRAASCTAWRLKGDDHRCGKGLSLPRLKAICLGRQPLLAAEGAALVSARNGPARRRAQRQAESEVVLHLGERIHPPSLHLPQAEVRFMDLLLPFASEPSFATETSQPKAELRAGGVSGR